MSNNNGGWAFPTVKYVGDADGGSIMEINKGMTLRDYFAAMAMQAKCTDGYSSWKYLAQDAYNVADAMLVERDKQ